MSSAPNRAAWNSRAKAILGALSLLVLGGVLGIALDRHLHSGTGHAAGPVFHEMAMSSLEQRLDLVPDQRRQIDSIMATRHDALRDTWLTLHAQFGATIDSVHRDIEAVLTPEQRRAFREWLRDVDP